MPPRGGKLRLPSPERFVGLRHSAESHNLGTKCDLNTEARAARDDVRYVVDANLTAMMTGAQAFAETLRKELAEEDIKVGNIDPGLTGSDMQLPDIPPEKQREMIEAAKMLRAEDIAVAAHFMLSQPRRTVVSLMRVEPRIVD